MKVFILRYKIDNSDLIVQGLRHSSYVLVKLGSISNQQLIASNSVAIEKTTKKNLPPCFFGLVKSIY